MIRLKKGRGERRNRDGAEEATPPTRKPIARPPAPPDAGQYLYRELSVLAFFRRVLEEAQGERNPLLERVKFSSILGFILAEFFMVRVAGLKQQIEAEDLLGATERSVRERRFGSVVRVTVDPSIPSNIRDILFAARRR